MGSPALHSVLGASSSERWMACPGSVKLSEGMPNSDSVYAREGSLAHEVAALALTNDVAASNFIGEEIKGFEDLEVTEEMTDAVQVYVDEVRRVKSGDLFEMDVEVRFDLSHLYPDMFGTADCVLYSAELKELIVFDYKHGRGIAVDAENNKQLCYYGVGALTGKHNRPVDKVTLVIVQPRCHHKKGPIRSWDISPMDLMDFTADLIEAAKKTQAPNAEFKVGEHCKFCRAAGICKTLENYAMESAMAEFATDGSLILPDPAKIDLATLKKVWERAEIIEDWAKNVQLLAHNQAVAGNILPGCKLVEGRKGHKKWRDETTTKTKLLELQELGYINEIEVTKLLTPAKIDSQLKKKEKDLINDLWEQPAGKLSLVSADDPRPSAVSDATTEF